MEDRIFANNMSDKGLISKIHKELIQNIIQLKIGRGSKIYLFSRRHIDGQQVHEKMLKINYQRHANQIMMRYITSHLLESLSSKRQEITSVSEDVEKREHLCTVGGNVNCYSHYGK